MPVPARSLSAALALVALLLEGSLFPAPAYAQGGRPPSEVEVTNTPDVNVVNTPTVDIGNVPSVEVSNTPSVELAPGAQFRDRDNPALQPVQFTCEVFLADTVQTGDTVCINESSLTGKTLVIEYINAFVTLPNGQRPEMRLSLTSEHPDGSLAGAERRYRFEDCGPVGGANTCHWLDRLVRVYRTTFNVVVRFGRSSPWTGDVTLTAHFSGYLVDNS